MTLKQLNLVFNYIFLFLSMNIKIFSFYFLIMKLKELFLVNPHDHPTHPQKIKIFSSLSILPKEEKNILKLLPHLGPTWNLTCLNLTKPNIRRSLLFWIVWFCFVWIWFGFFQEWNFSPKPQIISPISIPGIKTHPT